MTTLEQVGTCWGRCPLVAGWLAGASESLGESELETEEEAAQLGLPSLILSHPASSLLANSVSSTF